MPHISDSNCQEGVTLSESAHVCLFTCTLFPPNKHFTCFATFLLFVEILFYKASGPGPCHRPLALVVSWLGFSTLTPRSDFNFWPGTKILLQAAAGRGHPRSARQRKWILLEHLCTPKWVELLTCSRWGNLALWPGRKQVIWPQQMKVGSWFRQEGGA